MHEATVTVCPVTNTPMRNTRSHPTGVPSVKPGSPRGGSQIVVPRPMDGSTPAGPPPSRSARRSLIGQTVDGKYEVRAVLGEGGMGAVFEAVHSAIGRVVAMKVLHPAQATKKVAVKRFHQEARAAGGIGHPNICEVFDFGTLSDGSPYLVMERLKGETLASRIGAEGGLPFLDVIEIVMQVLSGLAAAHERGILHRDIKPENVFLAERAGYPAIVKLLDFGVSKVVVSSGEWDDDTDLTKTGMVMGTPYYMSPEQARGDRNLDGRVDIYACGVLLYEALTAQRPFVAKNYNTLLVQILQGNAKPPRALRASIPPELEQIVLKAMAKNREDRFQVAAEFSHELSALRKRLAKSSSGRVPAAVRAAVPAPGALSQSSTDIPIHFAEEGDSRTPGMASSSDEWEQTTAPMMEVPAEPSSPYDDPSEQQDTVYDRKATAKPKKEDGDERTDKMNQADIQHIIDAVREAREREKSRRRG
ncbi:MAG TPA: serine/threonine-protein kinase [Polyangiaceae bacterium]